MRVEETARQMYEAYLLSSGGLNYQGLPCPKWPDLTEAVRQHWCAAARVTMPSHVESEVMQAARSLRSAINDGVPGGRARAVAITKLDELEMWVGWAFVEEYPA